MKEAEIAEIVPKIVAFLRVCMYGQLTLKVQDGKVVLVEKTEKEKI